MKLARLTVLTLAVVLSMLTVPDAFGGRKGGAFAPNVNKNVTACDGDYYIYCYYNPSTACCYGSFDHCGNVCSTMCGGTCDAT